MTKEEFEALPFLDQVRQGVLTPFGLPLLIDVAQPDCRKCKSFFKGLNINWCQVPDCVGGSNFDPGEPVKLYRIVEESAMTAQQTDTAPPEGTLKPERWLVQSRESFEYNTDPQRRCFDGVHAKSEWVWRGWETMSVHPTEDFAKVSCEEWEEYRENFSGSRRIQYRYTKENHEPQAT